MSEVEWGTVATAAERYGVAEVTIRRMITRGEVEAKRFGPRLIRVNLTSLEAIGAPVAVTEVSDR